MNFICLRHKNSGDKETSNLVVTILSFQFLGKDRIVLKWWLHLLLQFADDKVVKLTVRIREDQSASRTVLKDVSANIALFIDLAPDGSRIDISAVESIFQSP
jgi:hypothetical protein